MCRMYEIFAYMKGEKQPHEKRQGEMFEHLGDYEITHIFFYWEGIQP